MAAGKETKLIDLDNLAQQPLLQSVSISGTNSPGKNPFDTLSQQADTFTTLDIENDLNIFSRTNIEDYGRESLGIMHVDWDMVKFNDDNWSHVMAACVDSFNSNIYSDSLSYMNKGFTNDDSEALARVDIKRRNSLCEKSLKQIRSRIASLPGTLQEDCIDCSEEKDEKALEKLCAKAFRKSQSLHRMSFMMPSHSIKMGETEDDDFNDSIFIEANYIAEKIGDNSILDLANGELYSLDCTSQPQLMDLTGTPTKIIPNCTEDIFKTVDKMVPGENDHTANSADASNPSSPNEILQNLSNIPHLDDNKLSTSRISQNSNNSKSKWRDAKSMIHSLSDIINSGIQNEQQKSEGQHLLSSLGDILSSEDDNQMEHSEEDLGHSSIDREFVLDLRTNAEVNPDETQPLDLSLARKNNATAADSSTTECVEKQRRTSYKSSGNKEEAITSRDTKSFNNLKTNISKLSSMGKFKTKKIDPKAVSEKGPLKATIPLGNMARAKDGKINSPKRFGTSNTASSRPGPAAQSTPDTNSALNKRKTINQTGIPTSPLARTRENNSRDSFTNRSNSGSIPNLSSNAAGPDRSFSRRRSCSDFKSSADGNKFKRSNSIDKDNAIAKSLSRVRENVAMLRKSRGATEKSNLVKPGQGKSVLGHRNSTTAIPVGKPCNLANKMRKSYGKENVA